MASLMSYGLSTLMEAINHSQRAEDSSDQLAATFEEAIDDDIIKYVTGDDDDEVEDDMDGDGIGEEDEEMERLLAKIPPSDEMDEEILEDLEEACEAFLPGMN